MEKMNIRSLSFYDKEVLLAMVRGKSMTLEELKDKLHYLQDHGVFSAFNRAFNAQPGSVVRSIVTLRQARLVHSFPYDSGSMSYLLSSEGYRLQQSK